MKNNETQMKNNAKKCGAIMGITKAVKLSLRDFTEHNGSNKDIVLLSRLEMIKEYLDEIYNLADNIKFK